MKWVWAMLAGVVGFVGVMGVGRGDILVRRDHGIMDGVVVSQDATEVVWLPDGATNPAVQQQKLVRGTLSRVILADEHGAWLSESSGDVPPATQAAKGPAHSWSVPADPVAPPVNPAHLLRPMYYLIPLHGEVGVTLLAGALEKSLADAALRKPMIVVLDIDSPGGSTEEAAKIIKVLHQYNKVLRIVALVDKDLSAAAVFTLSVKEIYIKPTGTVGAARAFMPTKLWLPPKIEEKMESAWRAVARNSATEGGHEPLLADAMIDTNLDLNVVAAGGKKMIKEGVGPKMICRKGEILTLSSKEAVDCGLAVGQAEDVPDLLRVMNISTAIECKGIGVAWSEVIAKRLEVLQGELKKLGSQLDQNLLDAKTADPSGGEYTKAIVWRTNGTTMPAPPKPTAAAAVLLAAEQKLKWKEKSLTCVLALQKAEQNFKEAIALGEAFGQPMVAEISRDYLLQLGVIRSTVYEDRNKHAAKTVAPMRPVPPKPATTGPTTSPATTRPKGG